MKITATVMYDLFGVTHHQCFVPSDKNETLHFWDPKKKVEYTVKVGETEVGRNTCTFEFRLLDLDYYQGVRP